MSKIGKKDYTYLLFILVLLLVLVITQCSDNRGKKDVRNYDYKTDTIYSSNKFKDLETMIEELGKKVKETPPREVVYYKTDNPKNVVIEKIPDSLILYIGDLKDSLNKIKSERVSISDKYIKNYPEAGKLINFTLNIDSLNLALLNIDGNIEELKYPLYLDKYNYYWSDDKLVYVDRKNKPDLLKDNTRWKNLYINVGYEFIYLKPTFDITYDIKLGRFKLGLESGLVYYDKDPLFFTKAKLGFRLLK